MMYPFITLDDDAEIVHSEMREDGTVKVYMEKPVEGDSTRRRAFCRNTDGRESRAIPKMRSSGMPTSFVRRRT